MRYKSVFIVISLICTLALPVFSLGRLNDAPCPVAKFTGEGEDFSVSNAIHLCPFDAACAGTSLYEKLSVLRQVREKVLKPTKLGNQYVLIFGQHAVELAQLVLENPELAKGVRDLSLLLLPIAQDLLHPEGNGKHALLDSDDAVRIRIMAVLFEEKASPELRKQIKKFNWELDQFVGKTTPQIMEILKDGDLLNNGMKLMKMFPVIVEK